MKYAMLSAACLALAAQIGNAHADTSAQGQVQLKASVNMVCSGAIGGTLNITGFLLPSGMLADDQGGTMNFGTVTCNYPAYVSVRTTLGALKVGTTPCDLEANIANCMKYTAKVTWAGQVRTVIADATPEAVGRTEVSGPTGGPATGEAKLDVMLDGPSGKPFVGGDYTDTLVVKIGQTL
jgi:hypothetical protein